MVAGTEEICVTVEVAIEVGRMGAPTRTVLEEVEVEVEGPIQATLPHV